MPYSAAPDCLDVSNSGHVWPHSERHIDLLNPRDIGAAELAQLVEVGAGVALGAAASRKRRGRGAARRNLLDGAVDFRHPEKEAVFVFNEIDSAIGAHHAINVAQIKVNLFARGDFVPPMGEFSYFILTQRRRGAEFYKLPDCLICVCFRFWC